MEYLRVRYFWMSWCMPLCAFAFAASCNAETYQANPSNYLGALKQLRSGDQLLLAAGEYRHGLPLHGLNGEAGKPIVISGPRTGDPAIFLGREGANTISIIDSSHVTVRDMVLDGRGLAVDAVKAEGHAAWAHHITIESLRIVNHDYDQQIVGISTKCPAWGWVIRGNIIVAAGTGMYLGHPDGSAPFISGTIENNVVVDSIGYNLQIKHQKARPKIEGMPEKSSVTVIRHNVFAKSANSSGGNMARPNVLVGHWPSFGPGVEDMYAIYGNFFYQNPSEALFQGEGNIAFYSNVLINAHGDAINIRPHNAIPRRIDLFRNTVLAVNTGIRVTGGDPLFRRRITANVVFASIPIVGGEQYANRTGPFQDAADDLNDPFAPLGRLDLSPKAGRFLAVPFTISSPVPLPDTDRDFEGRVYLQPMAGAYAGAGAAWSLQLERKR